MIDYSYDAQQRWSRIQLVKGGHIAPAKSAGIYDARLRGNYGSASPLAIGQSVDALRERPQINWIKLHYMLGLNVTEWVPEPMETLH